MITANEKYWPRAVGQLVKRAVGGGGGGGGREREVVQAGGDAPAQAGGGGGAWMWRGQGAEGDIERDEERRPGVGDGGQAGGMEQLALAGGRAAG